MINKFNRFINFGSVVDKDKRTEIVANIYEQLQGNKNAISLSNDTTDNFATTIESILSNKTMRELCAKNSDIAEQVTSDILDFINDTKRYLQKLETPFENEQNLLNNFEQINKDSFEKSWEATAPFVQKTYEQEINTNFYYEEFQKSLFPSKKDKKSIGFESVKETFTEKWGALFFQKKLKWELEIIEKERKEFCEKLYQQIEQLKKLQELLEPFTNELGRLWDMSKGNWRNVNFDILKKYAEILQRDESLQKLAEMLGRMQSAEIEYEEEIFKDKKIKHEWKIEHASKAEAVGIHESNDISSMLPVEAALLSSPATEVIFCKKFAENKLQTFDYQAKTLSTKEEEFQNKRQKAKEDKKGPIIICVDTSGSMHGTPEQVEKTLSFALLKIAIRENRKCYLISFSTDIQTLELTNMKNNLEKLLDFLSMSFYGGTDAIPPMNKALQMLETEDYKKADIVMVSDFFMNGLNAEIREKIHSAKENKTKFHSLVIGDSGNQEVIEEFDSNWLYNANDPNRVLNLVKNLRENV